MSQAKCERRLHPPKTPTGITGYIKTTTGSTLDCNVTGTGSKYYLEIKNHNKYAVGIRINCKSVNGNVEFDNSGTYEEKWDGSIFLKPTSSKPEKETIKINIRPSNQQTVTDKIRTRFTVRKIVDAANPDVDENIKVNVN